MNYLSDPHDLKVLLSILRRALDVAKHWPNAGQLGPHDRAACARREARVPRRASEPSDALLEDMARHYAFTVYHPTTTCRIGDVVDPRLRV